MKSLKKCMKIPKLYCNTYVFCTQMWGKIYLYKYSKLSQVSLFLKYRSLNIYRRNKNKAYYAQYKITIVGIKPNSSCSYEFQTVSY